MIGVIFLHVGQVGERKGETRVCGKEREIDMAERLRGRELSNLHPYLQRAGYPRI